MSDHIADEQVQALKARIQELEAEYRRIVARAASAEARYESARRHYPGNLIARHILIEAKGDSHA